MREIVSTNWEYMTVQEAVMYLGSKSRKPVDKGIDKSRRIKNGHTHLIPISEILKAKDRYENDLNDSKTASKGSSHYCWNGGFRIDRTVGYRYIWMPDHPKASKKGYIAEHTIVMEQHLGRHLYDDEVVHHKNHNGYDNRVENLQLMTKQEHSEMHLKEGRTIRWGDQTPEERLQGHIQKIIDFKIKYGRFPLLRELTKANGLPSTGCFSKWGGYKVIKEMIECRTK